MMMMKGIEMPTKPQPTTDLSPTEEAREAQAVIDHLTERMRQGDPDIKPTDLIRAREALEAAQRRMAAEGEIEAARSLGARLRQASAIAEELPQRAMIVELAAAEVTLKEAMHAYLVVAERARLARNEVRAELHQLGIQEQPGKPDELAAAGIGVYRNVIATATAKAPPVMPVASLTDLARQVGRDYEAAIRRREAAATKERADKRRAAIAQRRADEEAALIAMGQRGDTKDLQPVFKGVQVP